MTRQIPLQFDANMTPEPSMKGRLGRVAYWIGLAVAVAICAIYLFSVPNLRIESFGFVTVVMGGAAGLAYVTGAGIRYVLGD